MIRKSLGWLAVFLVGLAAAPSHAADDVQADVVVHVTRVQPTHRLVETARLWLPYGDGANAIGFVPAGNERQAMGPSVFDVDRQGRYLVADPVHRRLIWVERRGRSPVVSSAGALPLPLSDLAVDGDGFIYATDLRSHSLITISSSATSRAPLPDPDPAAHFVRHGRDVVVSGRRSHHRLRHGASASFVEATQVVKCNAEAGLVTTAGGQRRIQIEIGGALASIRLIGVDANGDVFLMVEQFRRRGQLAVDRYVVVVDSSGTLQARLAVAGQPTVHPVRDFVLDSSGALHRMVPGERGVSFVRWEVRP